MAFNNPTLITAILAIASYLLGSIPFGLVLTRMFGAGDLRAIGSGNIGATNVLRTGRKGLAALTLVLDGAKGAIAVLAAQAIDPSFAPIAGLAALIGHCYPIWLRFKGGKGVATALGILLVISWPILAIAAGIWGLLLAITRIVSLSSIAAAVAAPLAALLLGNLALLPLTVSLGLLIIWKHRPNITRLMAGTEPRIGRSSPPSSQP